LSGLSPLVAAGHPRIRHGTGLRFAAEHAERAFGFTTKHEFWVIAHGANARESNGIWIDRQPAGNSGIKPPDKQVVLLGCLQKVGLQNRGR